MKDTTYYDAESSRYSAKRYPPAVTTYVQSFYKARLGVVLKMLAGIVAPRTSLVEVGCADGVVIKRIHDAFPSVFSRMVGTDISPKMIEEAQRGKGNRTIEFTMRNALQVQPAYDLVIEVGVLNYADADAELSAARSMLKPGGHYLCSIAGKGSVWDRLTRREDKGFANFLSYAEYERLLRKHLAIVAIKPVGLFIPHLWKVPALARIAQPIAEQAMRFLPNAFQEKIYLLKRR